VALRPDWNLLFTFMSLINLNDLSLNLDSGVGNALLYPSKSFIVLDTALDSRASQRLNNGRFSRISQ
jgi:hypothetical protein